MRTLIILGLALLPLLAGAQNARPVLADTNGVIRVGTVGSELTALNGTQVTTGTVAEARIDAALLRAATASTLYQGTNANLTTLGALNGGSLTNLNATNLVGTIQTTVLPGALGTLSTWNGGGLLTNLAYPQVYWFTNQGTTTNWTIPAGARSLFIRAVGGGGGGGSGRRFAAGSVISGGGGGSGGAYSDTIVGSVQNLWTNYLTIVIPAIRTGGASVLTDDTDGNSGAASANTIVYCGTTDSTNILLRVNSGSGAAGGDADGVTAASGGSVGSFAGGAGGASSSTGLAGSAGAAINTGIGGGGGGGGGGITTGSTPSAGGAGNTGPATLFGSALAASGGAIASNGTNFNANWNGDISKGFLHAWPGAGGGGSSTNSAGGNGADGYGWGSGGGGGGGSLNGFTSGKGGNGGPSAVTITVYCAFPAIAAPEWVGASVKWTMDAVSLIRHIGLSLIEMSKEQVYK